MKRYLPAVDILRFLAAVLVMVFHLGFAAWSGAGSSVAKLVGGRYALPELVPLWWGWVGVNIFFVISGLVIAGSADGKSAAQFVAGRIERLYPAVWICAPITLAVVLGTHFLDPADALLRFAKSMLLSPSGPWIDGQYWTLRNEIGFYATVLILIASGAFRHLARYTKALIVSGFVVVVADALSSFHHLPAVVGRIFALGSFQFLPLYYGCFFGLGIAIWLGHRGMALPPVYLAIAVVGGLIEISAKAYVEVESSRHLAAWRNLAFLLPAAVWLGSVLLCFRAKPIGAHRHRQIAVARSLGLATYPLYLIHFTLGAWLIAVLTAAGMPALASFALVALGLIASSLAIATYGERWVRGWLRPILAAIVRRLRLSTARRPLLVDAAQGPA